MFSLASGARGGQFVVEQVADALDRNVGGRMRGQGFQVVSVVALLREDGGQAVPPALPYRVRARRNFPTRRRSSSNCLF